MTKIFGSCVCENTPASPRRKQRWLFLLEVAFDLNEVSAARVCSLTDGTLFSDEKRGESLGFSGGKKHA